MPVLARFPLLALVRPQNDKSRQKRRRKKRDTPPETLPLSRRRIVDQRGSCKGFRIGTDNPTISLILLFVPLFPSLRPYPPLTAAPLLPRPHHFITAPSPPHPAPREKPGTMSTQVIELDNESRRPTAAAQDADVLANLGYEEELQRGWGLIENFGARFVGFARFPPFRLG
jgi:hypothetical protein